MILEPVEIGRVQRAQGLAGELRIALFLPDPEILAPKRILIRGGSQAPVRAREHAIARVRFVDPSTAVVKLADVSERASAEELSGATVWVDPTWFEEQHNPRLALIGGEVTDVELGPLGRVTDLFDNGAQLVLSVDTPRGEALIPFVEPFIVSVSGLWPKKVVIRSIPGLLPE
ncbi:MAG: 16S rRNA processing protein RimM [Deltaproteobacteria bacterium]|nr:16S rRNA processing protein RimM [Deltaproteobacteria bacterium]